MPLITNLIPSLRDHHGPLTEQLVRSPGGFGLGQLPKNHLPHATTTMTCGFCATGCGLNIHLDSQSRATGLTPATPYPVNLGMACPKGWQALSPLTAPNRATTPLFRDKRHTPPQNIDWNTALQIFCDRFKKIQQQHGAESIAFLGTGQICSEELAYLGSLAKFGMGMIHGDGNTRQCMATAVAAYKQSFGFDAPPYTYQDFEESDVIILSGSNLCIAHPILWQRILRNPHSPQIIVIDPRKTETANAASQHLAIEAKSDLVLYYGLANILIQNQWTDCDFIKNHCSDFDQFAKHVQSFTPEITSQRTGISVEELQALAKTIHQGKRVSFWWTMGINQGYEATRTAQAIINLALITGNIGRPGTGANSITGQCNAMGSRLFSNTTSLLGGHDFTNPEHRQKIANQLDIPVERIPDQNSDSYDQILEGIKNGKIRGLWIVATNPAHSWIKQNRFKSLLDKLDFLVVQDMYHDTQTAQYADLVLPAAAWGEKDGTFINSERRISVIKKVAQAPGQALADFHIFRLIADAWGCGDLFKNWTSPEKVFQILTQLTQNQACDITGIQDYSMLDQAGGIQWPYPKKSPSKEKHRRLFEDGRFHHSDGRAKLIFADPQTDPDPCDDSFPFKLNTGRGSSAQWHTQTRTRHCPTLKKLHPSELLLELHPQDAHHLGIRPNASIRISSRQGSLTATALITSNVSPGHVFLPMHHEDVNLLTHPSFDPHSRQPNYKSCAVRVEKP
ncbi:MAG: nitrate reductase [Verrucomicrobiota bacterium]